MLRFLSSYCLAALVLSIYLGQQSAFADAQVKISGFVDFNYGTWSSGSVSRSTDVCVYKSTGSSDYYITASGGAGTLSVTSSSNNLSYSVEFKQSNGSFLSLSHGVRRMFSGANQSAEDCGGSTNATLRCTFATVDLEAARPGSYSGTLSIMVEPN